MGEPIIASTAPARRFAIAPGTLLLAWDELGESRGSASLCRDGMALPPPTAATRIQAASGITRSLLVARLPDEAVSGSPPPSGPAPSCPAPGILEIWRGGAALRRVGATAEADAAALTEGLDAAGCSALLKFLLGMCRGLFRLGETAEFAAFAGRLAAAAVPDPAAIALVPRARLGADLALHGAALDERGAIDRLGRIETAFFITPLDVPRGVPWGVTESPARPAVTATAEDGLRLILAGPSRPTPGAVALLIGSRGALRLTPAAAVALAELGEAVARQGLTAAERHHALQCLGRAGGAPAAALARAVQLLAPEPARVLTDPKQPIGGALEVGLGCGKAGIFVRGWIRDPHGLVGGAELISPFGRADLTQRWHRVPRPDLAKAWANATGKGGAASGAGPLAPLARPGFIGLAPIGEPVPVLQHRLRLSTPGGTLEMVPPLRPLSSTAARDAVLSSILPRDLTAALLDRVIAPAAAELQRRAMAEQAAPEIVEIGAPSSTRSAIDPVVSAIIPLYRNLSFLRPQIGAFAIDPAFHGTVELIYVLDSPEQRTEVEHLLRGLAALTGLAFRLVVMSGNFGYAAANNTGARVARGRLLLLLNSDVLPLAPGWLATLEAGLAAGETKRPVGAVGPKLLFDDGSLQHAGLTFARDVEGRWYNTHFFKGYPRDWRAANEPRSVPGVTGAALLTARRHFEAVGGFSEDFVIGDFEDSDLCLKLRRAGLDIRYEPRAELYHFERRSIELHPGHARTIASAYNQRLHAERWSEAMAELAGDTGALAHAG